jgi:DGQHR domain-containing protein
MVPKQKKVTGIPALKSRKQKTPEIAGTTDYVISTIGLRVQQSASGPYLYVFIVDGKEIAGQLGVRKMVWQESRLEGFQRPLDKKRVTEIASYLSDNPILPNAIVVAFKSGTLRFDAMHGQSDPKCQIGTITINGKVVKLDGVNKPLPENERIGYVIDGQHRIRAIEKARLAPGMFNIVVNAFHDVDPDFALQQFYYLSLTVPIPPGQLALMRRQLPDTLTTVEANKKAISQVCGRLQKYPESPFAAGTYIGAAPVIKGPIPISVVEEMIDWIIKSTYLRYSWNQDARQITAANLDVISKSLYVYWKAVATLYASYWGQSPKNQRLFCAIGIYAMMRFFDLVMTGIDINSADAVSQVMTKLAPIKDVPWANMQAIPGQVKATFRPDHLFDAINSLWQANGKRPYNLKIGDPNSDAVLVDLELP